MTESITLIGKKIKTYPILDQNFLTLDKENKIFYRILGIKKGIPIMLLHGGPCGESKDKHLWPFDPKKHFIIQFDQPGCGKSQTQNFKNINLEKILKTINYLLDFLNLDKINLAGSSFGSFLALVFAIKNPSIVQSLFLDRIFLARKKDIEFPYKQIRYKKNYKTILENIEKLYFDNKNLNPELLFSYLDTDKKNLAIGFLNFWQYILYKNQLDIETSKNFTKQYTEEDFKQAYIYLNFEKNNFFVPENFILKNIEKIKNIKSIIFHGKKDILTHKKQAKELHKKLLNSKLILLNTTHQFTYKQRERMSIYAQHFFKK